MALKNYEKVWLKRRVVKEIAAGNDIKTTVNHIKPHGYKPATIRKYYLALSK